MERMNERTQKVVKKVGYWGSLGVTGAMSVLYVIHDCKNVIGKADKKISAPATLSEEHYAYNVVSMDTSTTSTFGLPG